MKQPNHYYYECEHLKRKRKNGGYLHTDKNRETDDGRCLSGITGHASKQNRFFINRKDLFPTFFSEYSLIYSRLDSLRLCFSQCGSLLLEETNAWKNERQKNERINERKIKNTWANESEEERMRADENINENMGKNARANEKARKKERKREHKRETKEAIAPRPNLNL